MSTIPLLSGSMTNKTSFCSVIEFPIMPSSSRGDTWLLFLGGFFLSMFFFFLSLFSFKIHTSHLKFQDSSFSYAYLGVGLYNFLFVILVLGHFIVFQFFSISSFNLIFFCFFDFGLDYFYFLILFLAPFVNFQLFSI